MMGEYVLYYKGKVAGVLSDNRLLIKPVKTAVEMTDNPVFEIPYPGAKPMLLVERLDDKEFLAELCLAMYDECPRNEKSRGEHCSSDCRIIRGRVYFNN